MLAVCRLRTDRRSRTEYLADGLTEEVIAILGSIDPSRRESSGARPRCSTRTQRSDPTKSAGELGVGYLVATAFDDSAIVP